MAVILSLDRNNTSSDPWRSWSGVYLSVLSFVQRLSSWKETQFLL